MKFRVTMKDPDGVSDSLDEAVKATTAEIDGLSEDEKETLRDARQIRLSKVMEKWFEFSEYLTVEIDTDANTCVVVERR